MNSKFNLAYSKEHEATGEIENSIRLDVYMDCLDNRSYDYFVEALITMCNGMSDYLTSELSRRD